MWNERAYEHGRKDYPGYRGDGGAAMKEQRLPILLNGEYADEVLNDVDVDAVIAATAENVMYVSDFELSWACFAFGERAYGILPRDNAVEPTLILPAWGLGFVAEDGTWMSGTRSFGDFSVAEGCRVMDLEDVEARFLELLRSGGGSRPLRAEDALGSAIRDLGLTRARLGTDDARTLDYLVEEFPDAYVRDSFEDFKRIRARKSPQEVERLRQAARINEGAVGKSRSSVTVGSRWAEVREVWEAEVVQARGRPEFWLSGAGARSTGLFPSEEFFLEGQDIIRLECGCTYKGYWADAGRTAILGHPSQKLQKYYGALLAAREEVEEWIRPGTPTRELPKLLSKAIRAHGLSTFAGTAWGHGLGLNVYEPPRVTSDSDGRLVEDMVFALETPYFESGWGGIQLEDTYLVTADGFERLTVLPQELEVIA